MTNFRVRVFVACGTILGCMTQSAVSDTIFFNELPQTPFYAVVARSSSGSPRGLSYGEFTWLGPVTNTLLPLAGSIGEVAANADRTRFFGMSAHAVYELTFNPSEANILTPQGVPQLSWTMGMTYDPTRDRLITATLGGEGFLYSYKPSDDEWSVISSLDGVDLTAIAYFPSNDRIYGVGAASAFSLYEFNSNGEFLSRRSIDIPIEASYIDRSIQLVAVDDYLAFIQYPETAELGQPTIHAIDPIAGTGYLVVVPEPTTLVLAGLGLFGLVSQNRRRRTR